MAERVGFEPTEPVKAHSISNAANSTALAPFRANLLFKYKADFNFIKSASQKSKIQNRKSKLQMAERVGFEPTVPVRVQQFSRLSNSTTLAPLRTSEFTILMV